MKRLATSIALVCVTAASAIAFDLQGHRGARGLAPENTIAAFATALSVGVTTLELDLSMTKDGVLVVSHDPWLNPDHTRGPDGAFLASRGAAIRSLTLDELGRYDVGRLKPGTAYAASLPEQQPVDGARIPTLAEVFALVRRSGADHVRFNIETKLTPFSSGGDTPDPETFARAFAAAVRDEGLASRVTIQSFDWRTLDWMRRLAPEIPGVCLSSQTPGLNTILRGEPGPSPWTAGLDVDDFDGSTPRLVAAAGCAIWSPNFRDLTPAWLAEARSLGLEIIPWTVNEPADLSYLVDADVEGIITDYPDRLRAVLVERGAELPPQVTPR